jgi:DNA-binding CsgD family transcriptional regulator
MRDRYATLTDIERTIFHGIVGGRLNKQLAVDIAICERTIKTHRARVMSKLQVASIVDLTRAAMTLGVLGEYRSRINESDIGATRWLQPARSESQQYAVDARAARYAGNQQPETSR